MEPKKRSPPGVLAKSGDRKTVPLLVTTVSKRSRFWDRFRSLSFFQFLRLSGDFQRQGESLLAVVELPGCTLVKKFKILWKDDDSKDDEDEEYWAWKGEELYAETMDHKFWDG